MQSVRQCDICYHIHTHHTHVSKTHVSKPLLHHVDAQHQLEAHIKWMPNTSWKPTIMWMPITTWKPHTEILKSTCISNRLWAQLTLANHTR